MSDSVFPGKHLEKVQRNVKKSPKASVPVRLYLVFGCLSISSNTIIIFFE